jgi:farnesyl diphosphate synthase
MRKVETSGWQRQSGGSAAPIKLAPRCPEFQQISRRLRFPPNTGRFLTATGPEPAGGIDEAGAMDDGPGKFALEHLMTTGTSTTDFARRLDRTAEDTEALLGRLLSDTLMPDEIARPKRLMDAMRYSTLGGGKRLRPFLVVESSAVFGVPREAALLAGAALECIHCYSLIHDDLPAMDNSDLRRGRPTLHKAYDDATAILAGDALLTLAFDIITRDEIHQDAKVRLLLTRALARAAGIGGMAGGQMFDLAGEGRFGDREPVDVARLHQMKTGALLRFGCISGALLGQATPQQYQALDDYGRALGEAFQIADDLLDLEGDAAALGKPAGQDAALNKSTFITQLGVDGAKQRVRDLLTTADAALASFGEKGDVLRAAARFVAERKN